MPRVFIAIELPDALAAAITDQHRDLDGAAWEAHPHITLAHFGEVEDERLDELFEHLAVVASRRCTVTPTNVGFFPDDGDPAVVWVGVDLSEELIGLAHELHEVRARFCGDSDRLVFRPHITIARTRRVPAAEVHRYAESFATSRLEPFTTTTFTVFESVAGRYKRLQTFGG